jgi:hypothetical protein
MRAIVVGLGLELVEKYRQRLLAEHLADRRLGRVVGPRLRPSNSGASSFFSSVDLPVALSPVVHTCGRQSSAPPNGAAAMKP